MQHANPAKRPVGRPRLNTAQGHASLTSRLPPSSALNVDLSSITSSNETTNHFLGAGAVQRPWMRPNDPTAKSYPATSAPAPHTRTSLTRSPTNTSIPTIDSTSHVQPPLSDHTRLPPYRFISTPAPTHTEGSVTVQGGPADIESSVSGNNVLSSGHNSTLQETGRPTHHVEILDLTLNDEESLQPAQNSAVAAPANIFQPEPVPSQQPGSFADLPILEIHKDFDLIATDDNNTLINIDACEPTHSEQDTTMSDSTDLPAETPAPRPSTSQLAPTGSIPIQVAHANTSTTRDSSWQPSGNFYMNATSRPPQSSRNLSHAPNMLRQSSATAYAQQPSGTPAMPRPYPTQLLTPEHSPLSHSTTLSQPQQPSSEWFRPWRPPPLPQTRNPQSRHGCSSISQPIVLSQPGPVPGGLPFTAQRPSNVRSIVPPRNKGISYLAMLNSNLEDMSSRIDLNNPQWNLRLPWLRDACQGNDLFFLHLNQLFCMWNMNSATIRYLGISKDCDAGFTILELLFGRNIELPTELLAFLAGWPNSTYSLEFNEQMRSWTSQIAQFLPVFGRNWQAFRQRYLERKVPPMVSEIVHHLGCPMSMILPRAVFCSLQKQISPTAPAVLQTAVFNFFNANVTAASSLQPGSADFYTFKAVYQSIYAHFLRTPGLDQDQINEIRSILVQYDPPRPTDQLANAAPVQYLIPSGQTLLNVNVSNDASTTRSTAAPSQPMNVGNLSNQQIPTALLQASPNATPLVPTSVPNSSTPPTHQVSLPSPSTLQQQRDGSRPAHTYLMRPPNMLTSQNRPALLLPTVVTTQGEATSLPTPPLLGSGFVPTASERLLPIDSLHLPDFLVNPDPLQESLHQAHLRQPITELKVSLSGDRQRLYQYIESFVLNPYPWLPSLGFIGVSFDVSGELFRRRSETIEQRMGPFEIPKRAISTDSILFHLRCVKIDNRQFTKEIDSSWAALPTYWPQHIFISINNKHLEIRRKRHNRRDLPIDVTSFVVPGKNEVKISIHPEASEQNVKHGIAVEVIGFCDHERALALPTKIGVDKSLKSITSVMEPREDSNDDDLVLMDDNMTISITDPFSSRVFTIPVRGRNCRHRECFDLETFLKSRQSDCKDALTSVYAWQCPICKGDARPCNLVIDEFFKEVCDKVVELGQEEARAIIVKVDGTWVVKQDPEETSSANRSSSRQRSQATEGTPTSRVMKVMGHDDREPTSSTIGPQPDVVDSSATAASMPPPSSRIIEIIELD